MIGGLDRLLPALYETTLMDDLIRQNYLSETSQLHARYDSAKPFRHLVMDEFFSPEFAEALLSDFPPFDQHKAMNEDGKVGGKCVHEQLGELAAPYQRLDRLIQTREFLDWLGQLTGIDDLRYDPHYFGGGTHENCHGQDLDPHVDFNKHPETGLHRRLNLIVYLNREWSSDWGGAIEFHEDPRRPPDQNRITTVLPAFNRAVLFETTHWSWHGFERINLPDGDQSALSRKSVALYFYSEDRPKEEQTKPHSTIYVERPLPGHIRPGEALAEPDYQHILGLLSRRDQHLQRLYRNISDLSANVEDLIEQRDRAMAMVKERDAELQEVHRELQTSFLHRASRWLRRRFST
jgi:hypothetical protein